MCVHVCVCKQSWQNKLPLSVSLACWSDCMLGSEGFHSRSLSSDRPWNMCVCVRFRGNGLAPQKRNRCGTRMFDGGAWVWVKGCAVVMATPLTHKQKWYFLFSRVQELVPGKVRRKRKTGHMDTRPTQRATVGERVFDRATNQHQLDSERKVSRSAQTSHLDLSLDLAWLSATHGREITGWSLYLLHIVTSGCSTTHIMFLYFIFEFICIFSIKKHTVL